MNPLREILFRTTARYLTVRSDGLVLPEGVRRSANATIINHGGARTLYRGRRPHCRSLNGVRSIAGSACGDCHQRKGCTPQVRLDLLIDGCPYRLLLTFTSAKAFLLYAQELRRDQLDVSAVTTRLSVVNRGTWGELRFQRVRKD